MFKNNYKIVWRNLLKDRLFAALNLLGLSTGLASTLMICLWVNDELGVNKYNQQDARLYQVMSNIRTDAGIKTGEYTPGILANALAAEVPEIEYAVPVLSGSWFPYLGIASDNSGQHIKARGQYVGKDFFNLFTTRFQEGNKSDLFRDRSSVAISADLAKKLFNTTRHIVGRTLRWEQQEFSGSYSITGVFERNPPSATEQFDLLFNYELVPEKRPGLKEWGNSDPNTFVLLKKGTDVKRLNGKISDFVKRHDKNASSEIFIRKYSEGYLYGRYEEGVQAGGRIIYVRLFSIIAVFILVIACINFMNLSTAKASRRLKEVGIKKLMGARRETLVIQYLGESMLMSFLALLLSIIFVLLLLPLFNEIAGKRLSLPLNWGGILTVLGITLLTGLLAGSYPAFYLSRFNPAAVLKNTLGTSFGELWIRKGLVVFQFTLSILFIAAVMIVYRQLDYIENKNLGYNRENLIHFEIPLQMDSTKLAAAANFVKELRNTPGVVNASSYYHNLTGDHGAISGFDWPGKDPGNDVEFSNLEVGYHFLETAGIRIMEGRNFSENDQAGKEIIFNESAIKAMGIQDPVGKTIRFWGMEKQIVGIAADFNFESLYQRVKPCFFQVFPVMPNIMVRVGQQSEKQTIERIQKLYTQFSPGMLFDYRFLDEDYQQLYNAEKKVGMLSRYFAAIAIIICCLGLFGLAAFTAQRRQKEIGIRKVIGASVARIALLISREFLRLVGIALLIAFPLVWWTMNYWLDGFAYRIYINAGVFILTALTAVSLTLITISYQAIKAAVANPVKSLRSE